MWDTGKTTARARHSFPHEGSRSIAKNGARSSAATAASGDIDFEERGSLRRFRQIYLSRVADIGAVQA